MSTTTIRLKHETIERLRKHKKYSSISDDDLLNELLDKVEKET